MTVRPALLALLLAAALPARAERELHWRSLDVTATLDARGELHVVERQVMVFTGDWNGGERQFRVEPGQQLRFEGITRLAGPSSAKVLVPGDLDEVDEYRLFPGNKLRWRARRPSDPPFRGTELTYELRYTLARILVAEEGGGYRLAHDFAFPDRDGVIERFSVKVELDPAWKAERAEGEPLGEIVEHLEPGAGAVLTLVLQHSGAKPPAVWAPPPPPAPPEPPPPFEPPWRLPLLGLAAALLAGAYGWLRRDAGRRGLLGPAPGPVTEQFLTEHVWSLPPEVVGAAWDDTVGSPEVSAVLARMTAEGKLEVRATPRLMGLVQHVHLKLRVDRNALGGYEHRLVAGLFPNGNETDSGAIRAHYRGRGFDPSTRISSELQSTVHRLYAREGGSPAPGAPTKPARWPRWVSALLLVAGLVAAFWGLYEREHPLLVIAPAFAGVFAAAFAQLAAGSLAHAVVGRGRRLALAAAPLLAWLGFVLWLAWDGAIAELEAVAGRWAVLEHGLLWAAAVVSAAGAARSRLVPGEVVVRRRLAAARRQLAAELEKPRPALDDGAIPYLLALGLGRGIDRWLKVHGPAAAVTAGRARAGAGDGSTFSGTGGAGGGSAWTGGGGAFSGGGASGSWAALSSVSSGVTAPSSSSSSGSSFSSSSSSSSSGGGGGGGW